MKHNKYITDLGEEITLRDNATGKEIKIYRYGVWAWDEGKFKYQVIDTGADPDKLKLKHAISSDVVLMKDRCASPPLNTTEKEKP